MNHTTVSRPLPPRGAPWLLVALSALAIGLLRSSISFMFEGDQRAAAPLVAFILVGPAAILMYFYLKIIGRPIHIGTLISSPVKAAFLTALAVAAYATPDAILEGFSPVGATLTVGISAIVGYIVFYALDRYFKNSTPDTLDGQQ